MIKAIEKATNMEYKVQRIEGGYEVFTLSGEKYKKLKESTFKKYFKLTGETVEEEKPKRAKVTEKTEPKKAQAKATEENPVVHEELSPEDREKWIEKIKKILNLAKDNPSIEEGMAAALQAQKLMAKYNIHEDEVTLEEIKDEITSIFTEQKHNSHLLGWRKQLATIVARNFRCKCYLQGKDVVFRGYRQDAEIALEVYLSLYKVGDALGSKAYNEQKNETGSGKGAYTSFVAGFLRGVEEGLGAQCTALMIIVPKEVEEEFAEFSASFKTSKTRLSVSDHELYQRGKAEGKSAVKGRAIEKK